MPVKVGDDLADIVSAAIMEQAAKDYRRLRQGGKVPGESIESMRSFFNSEICQLLCGEIDPMHILEKLDAEPTDEFGIAMVKVKLMRQECDVSPMQRQRNIVGANLLELRVQKGLMRSTVWEGTGVATSSLLSYENAKITAREHNLKRLADYYDVTVEWLTSWEG